MKTMTLEEAIGELKKGKEVRRGVSRERLVIRDGKYIVSVLNGLGVFPPLDGYYIQRDPVEEAIDALSHCLNCHDGPWGPPLEAVRTAYLAERAKLEARIRELEGRE